MKVRVHTTFRTRSGEIVAGRILDISPELLPKIEHLVEVLPPPRAWIENGELSTVGVFDNLAAEIARLTVDDLQLQRRLLVEHCQAYAPTHFWALAEAWAERAAIMEHDGGLTREQAEVEAARRYHLTAWLPELRSGTVH